MNLLKHLRTIKSFQSRILIPYLSILISLQIIVFGLLAWTASKMVHHQMSEELRLTSRSFERLIVGRDRDLVATAQTMMSEDEFLKDAKTGKEMDLLSAMRRHYEHLGAQHMSLVSPAGIVIADVSAPERSGQEFENRKLLEQAVGKNWHAALALIEGRPQHVVVVPVHAPTKVGWLVLGFEVSKDLVVDFGREMDAQILFATSPAGISWKAFSSTFDDEQGEAVKNLPTPRTIPEGEFEMNIAGTEYAVSYWPMSSSDPSLHAGVFFFRPSAKAASLAHNTYFIMFGIFLLCLVLFISIGLSIASSVAMPLQQLMADALLIASGELDVYVNVDGDDEIGRLGQALRVMTIKLKEQMVQTHKAYETLQKGHAETMLVNLELDRKLFETSLLLGISKAITRSTDSEELLERILEKIMVSYSIDRGSILLVDETKGEMDLKLVKKLVHGKNKVITLDAEPRIRLRIGEGVAGQVLRTGEPLFVSDIGNSKDFLKYDNWRDDTMQSMVCIPLKRGNTAIGVMNLVQEMGSGTLKESDLEFLSTLATHISMIVENTELYRASVTDGMTGLFNKRYFTTRLNGEMDAAKEGGTKIGLLFIDIDFFKRLNDTFGHLVGDQVLIEIAREIAKAGRKTDLRARYGGEEFAVILPDVDQERLLSIAERLRQNIEAKVIPTDHGEMRVTISIGAALAPDHARDATSLVEQADAALYAAKNTGRNRVCLAQGEVSEFRGRKVS